MPLNGLTLTSISELKGCWRDDAAARAEDHSSVGLQLGGDLAPTSTKNRRFNDHRQQKLGLNTRS